MEITETKDKSFRIASIVLLAVGVAMFVGGFFVPPLGIIDGSLIKAFGEILGAIGLLFAWDCTFRAIDKGVDTTVTHKDTTIKVGAKENKN